MSQVLGEILGKIDTLSGALPQPAYVTITRGEHISSVGLQMYTLRDVQVWRNTLAGMPDIEPSWIDVPSDLARYIFVYRGIEFDVYLPHDVINVGERG